ncbi:potassium channel family protein [Rhizobium favelukesii]
MVACELPAGRTEGWSLTDALYFTLVTGLTIGYGDMTPHLFSSPVLAVVIGFSGIVITGLVAAVSVQALRGAGIDPNS